MSWRSRIAGIAGTISRRADTVNRVLAPPRPPPTVTAPAPDFRGDAARTAEILTKLKGKTGVRRWDAWSNILTKVGTAQDKRTAAVFEVDPVSHHEARDLWRGDDIAKKVIELLPRDGMRRGITLKFEDKQRAEKLDSRLQETHLIRKFKLAGQYERAYGGAALLPVMNDQKGQLFEKLAEDRITNISAIHLFAPRQLQPAKFYEDPMDDKFGQVEIWRLVPIGVRQNAFASMEIHESRMIIFPGVRVDVEQPSGCEMGWGDNVLTVMRHVLRDYNMTWASCVSLLQEMSQGVFKMSGLARMLAEDQDDLVEKRMTIIDVMKSVLRSIVIDKDDDYVKQNNSISGLPEGLQQFCIRMAAAADLPVTKMMGQSPAGMNATGESDITIYDDSVDSWREEHTPQIEQAVRLFVLEKDGAFAGKEPDVWSVEWPPLRQPTALEQATLRKTVAETDQINIGEGIYSADDAARSHYGGDTFSPDVTIDWEEREAQAEAVAQAEAEALAFQQQQLAAAAQSPRPDPNAGPPGRDPEAGQANGAGSAGRAAAQRAR